ncbi:hypothetical protein [Streptomyces sp. enrichment culture]|uniref:hypothetical protein n=1 Tax=Streptomyces sp. enrichment culture TaxID=1795815 RepID=UPI003F548765
MVVAVTPPLRLVLPVRLDIGGHAADVGTLDVDARQPIGPQIADALRDLADAIRAAAESTDDEHQEVSDDGTP